MADTGAKVVVLVAEGAQARSEAQRWVLHSESRSAIDNMQVVIEKLTKNVNEEHLREIFGSYGQIRDLDMPMNRQCKIIPAVS